MIPPKLDAMDVRNIRRWLNQLRDYVLQNTPKGDGKTVRVNQGCISAIPQGGKGTVPQLASSGSSVVPAKIVSKDGAFYLVDLYADGFDEAATETNVLAQILMLNYADTLPAGTKVLVASNYIDSTGGGTP